MVENEEECTYMYVMPVQKVKKKKKIAPSRALNYNLIRFQLWNMNLFIRVMTEFLLKSNFKKSFLSSKEQAWIMGDHGQNIR